VPPLRERKEDIPLLAQRFLKKMCSSQDSPPVLSPDAVHALMLHNWPGNITELESKIKGATVMAIGPQIFKHHIFADDEMNSQEIVPFKEAKEMFEISYITNLLKKSKGNITLAANIARKDRKNLYQKIQKYGIDVNQFRK
jgi:two-component system response regulator GlrR